MAIIVFAVGFYKAAQTLSNTTAIFIIGCLLLFSAMEKDSAFVEPDLKCELSKIFPTNYNTLNDIFGLTWTYFVLKLRALSVISA